MNKERVLRFVSLAAALFAMALPVSAQAPELGMLNGLNPGNWDMHLRSDGSDRSICLRTGRELIQIQHRQNGCSHIVVQDDPGEVTVQYTCRGDGYGRTTIRRESNGLVQIRSQGIKGGTPFSLQGEARRTGPC